MKIDADKRGSQGEKALLDNMTGITIRRHILTNLYVPVNNETTEVDLLILHESGIYVLEAKNYSGWIFGNEKSEMWMQTFKNGDHNSFYNPVKQNDTHIKALTHYLGSEIPLKFYSYVVFGDDCTLKEISLNEDSISNVTTLGCVRTLVNRDMKRNESIYDVDTLDILKNKLEPLTHVPDEVKQEHKNRIREKYAGRSKTTNKKKEAAEASGSVRKPRRRGEILCFKDKTSEEPPTGIYTRSGYKSSEPKDPTFRSFLSLCLIGIAIAAVVALLIGIGKGTAGTSATRNSTQISSPASEEEHTNGEIIYSHYSDTPSMMKVENKTDKDIYVKVYHYGKEILEFFVKSGKTAEVNSAQGTFKIQCTDEKGNEVLFIESAPVPYMTTYEFTVEQ